MIEILRILSCISYAEFLQVMNKQDDYWSQEKFNQMKLNLADFLMNLDTSTATRFIEFAADKAGETK